MSTKIVTDLQPGDIARTGKMWRTVEGVFVHTSKTTAVNFTYGPGRIYNNTTEVEVRS